MKRLSISLLVTVLFVLILSACGGQSGGPQVWIDRPLDNTSVPLAPLIIQAHASDESGISAFEIYIGEDRVQGIDVDGKRLDSTSYEWNPSSPGEYTIRVRAKAMGGDFGAFASTKINIGGEAYDVAVPQFDAQPAETTFFQINNVRCDGLWVIADINIGNPAGIKSYEFRAMHNPAEIYLEETFSEPYPTLIAKEVRYDEVNSDSIDQHHQAELEVMFVDDPNPSARWIYEPGAEQRCPGHYVPVAVDPGPIAPLVTARTTANCRKGPGLVYGAIDTISEGQIASIVGRNADSSWWFIDPETSSQDCWIAGSVVEVLGEISGVAVVAAPPLPTQPPGATQPPVATDPPPPVDDTPPSFYSTGVAPETILTEGGGCPAYARTTTVAAVVAEAEGISSVVAYWNIDGTESGQVTLQEFELGYGADIGPVTTTGMMAIYMIATDTSGNSAQSGTLYVTVNNCIN